MSEILIIGKNDSNNEMIRDYLEMHDHEVTIETDENSGLAMLKEKRFSLVIFECDNDMMVAKCRQRTNIPLIVILSDNSESAMIKCLNAGADDCIGMPLRMGEFTARVDSKLVQYRRLTEHRVGRDIISISGVKLDMNARNVEVRGEKCRLTNKEYELLKYLMLHADVMIDGKVLYREIWGDDYNGSKATVVVHVRKLREKIEENPKHPRIIETRWGEGYCFKALQDKE